jgi:hypothetical protein
MKHSTAHNHLTRLKSATDSIHSAARSYRSPHADILARMTKEVWEDPALAKCPSWVRAGLSNHSMSKLHEIQRHFVMWAFMCPDGKPRVWEQLDEETRRSYCSAEKTGNHFWLKLTNSHSHFGVVHEQTFTQVWEITSDIFS